MEEVTKTKKGKGPMFWFIMSSVFWLLLFSICIGVTSALFLSDDEVNTLLSTKVAESLGVEVEEEETDGLTEEQLQKMIADLEEENEILKEELEEEELRKEIEDEIRREMDSSNSEEEAEMSDSDDAEVDQDPTVTPTEAADDENEQN